MKLELPNLIYKNPNGELTQYPNPVIKQMVYIMGVEIKKNEGVNIIYQNTLDTTLLPMEQILDYLVLINR